MEQTLKSFEAELGLLVPDVAVSHLKAGPTVKPPYLCWYVSGDSNFYADDIVYILYGWTVVIELYSRTDGQGFELYKKLRQSGYRADIKDDNFIQTENLWVTIIEVQVPAKE